jgi:hypothetical protein
MGGKPAGKVQLVQTMLGSTVFCVGIENLDGKRKVGKGQPRKAESKRASSAVKNIFSGFQLFLRSFSSKITYSRANPPLQKTEFLYIGHSSVGVQKIRPLRHQLALSIEVNQKCRKKSKPPHQTGQRKVLTTT